MEDENAAVDERTAVHNQWLLLGGIGVIALAIIWRFALAATFLAMPSDFSYVANIDSIDNFYDARSGDFSGEQQTRTRFSYRFAARERGNYLVVNQFDVNTVTGEPVFSVEHTYGIDPVTRRHVAGYGDKDRRGFLFGPSGGGRKDFTYWHVNYDTPVTMQFQGEETLSDLRVDRYQAIFQTDQTQQLNHLPDVPDVRGVNLDVTLTVWIEPETGWLVKYEDDATAYFYDRQTKERLHPWNRFSNRYTDFSVNAQVAHARVLRSEHVLQTLLIPLCLTFVGVLAVFYGLYPKRFPMFISVAVVCLGLVVIVGWFSGEVRLVQIVPSFVPMQFNTALGFLMLGIAFALLQLKKGAASNALALVVAILGLLTLYQYLFGHDLGIDELLMTHDITTKTSHPGRMAPNTALCFLLASGMILLGNRLQRAASTPWPTFIIASVLLCLALVAAVGYIAGWEGGYGWASLTRMALHTSLGFLTCVSGMFCVLMIHESGKQLRMYAAPLLIALMGLVVTLCIHQSILFSNQAKEKSLLTAQSQQWGNLVRHELENRLVALHRMGQRWENAGGTSVKAWESDSANYVEDLPGFHLIAWIDPELRTQRIMPADREKNAFDELLLSAEHVQAALQQSREANITSVSNVVQFGDRGKMIFAPIPLRIEGRFDGYLTALLDIEQLLQHVLANQPPTYLIDVIEDGTPIYQHNDHRIDEESQFVGEANIKFAGIDWILRTSLDPAYSSTKQSRLGFFVVVCGWTVTALLSSISFLFLTARRSAVLNSAQRRTIQSHRDEIQTIVDNFPGGLLYVDGSGRILRSNKGGARSLIGNADASEQQPRLCRDVYPEFDDTFTEMIAQVRQSGVPVVGRELEQNGKDGKRIWSTADFTPVPGPSGEMDHVLISVADITDRKEMELELRRSNDDLDQFAYVASHDLKSPLRAVKHYVVWAREDSEVALPDEVREHLMHAEERVDRMGKLLDDLLTYARIGRDDGDSTEIDTNQLVRDIAKLVLPPDGFVIEVKGKLPNVHSASFPLECVFRNLIANSVNHHDLKSGRIEISGSSADNFAEFTVTDDGPGIPEKYHARVFEMFQGLDKSKKGTGMGLAIVKKIVETHGGTIAIESGAKRGLTMRIRWPIHRVDPFRHRSDHESTADRTEVAGTPRVTAAPN